MVTFMHGLSLSYRFPDRRHIAARSNDSTSFNNWEGIQSLNGFDSFNGQNNFDGSRNSQTVIVQEQETVCETVQVTISEMLLHS